MADASSKINGLPPRLSVTRYLTIAQVVRNHVIDTLVMTKGNQRKAAPLLGVARESVARFLRNYRNTCSVCGSRVGLGRRIDKRDHESNCTVFDVLYETSSEHATASDSDSIS